MLGTPWNALTPMLVSDVGKSTDVMNAHCTKAEPKMLVTVVLERSTEVMSALSNARLPISLSVAGKDTDVSEWHCRNAWSEMDVSAVLERSSEVMPVA